jgi:hypothetical protein
MKVPPVVSRKRLLIEEEPASVHVKARSIDGERLLVERKQALASEGRLSLLARRLSPLRQPPYVDPKRRLVTQTPLLLESKRPSLDEEPLSCVSKALLVDSKPLPAGRRARRVI